MIMIHRIIVIVSGSYIWGRNTFTTIRIYIRGGGGGGGVGGKERFPLRFCFVFFEVVVVVVVAPFLVSSDVTFADDALFAAFLGAAAAASW